MEIDNYKHFSPYFTDHLSKYLDGEETEGVSILSALRVSIFKGICEEHLCSEPINSDEEFHFRSELMKNASKYRDMYFFRIDNIAEAKYQLAIRKFNPIINLKIFNNISLANDNGILRPPKDENYVDGMHAVMLVGYNNKPYTYENGQTEIGFLSFVNSWGDKWGDNGIGYISNEYFNKYVNECFVLISEKIYFEHLTFEKIHRYSINNYEYRLYIGYSNGYLKNNSEVILCVLFDETGTKIGYLNANVKNKSTVEIIDFFVWPSVRCNGFGELILSVFLEEVIEKKYNLVFGWLSNIDKEKDGFVIISKFFTEKNFEYTQIEDVYQWSKYILYGDPNKISNRIKDFDEFKIKT